MDAKREMLLLCSSFSIYIPGTDHSSMPDVLLSFLHKCLLSRYWRILYFGLCWSRSLVCRIFIWVNSWYSFINFQEKSQEQRKIAYDRSLENFKTPELFRRESLMVGYLHNSLCDWQRIYNCFFSSYYNIFIEVCVRCSTARK